MNGMYQIANDKAVTAVGAAAASSVFWLDLLKEVSGVAGLLLPIFGVGLLILQGYLKIRAHHRDGKRKP